MLLLLHISDCHYRSDLRQIRLGQSFHRSTPVLIQPANSSTITKTFESHKRTFIWWIYTTSSHIYIHFITLSSFDSILATLLQCWRLESSRYLDAFSILLSTTARTLLNYSKLACNVAMRFLFSSGACISLLATDKPSNLISMFSL